MTPQRFRLFMFDGDWTPRKLASVFPQFFWAEPSLSPLTMWQDAAGATPVTAAGQVAGLLLGQSNGLALGPELVGDPELDSPGYWTVAGTDETHTVTFSGGTVRIAVPNTSPVSSFYRDGIVTVGRTYRVEAAISAAVSGQLRLSSGFSATAIPGTVGTYAFSLTAIGTRLEIVRHNAPCDVTITRISVREILGAVATQSTTANKPTYQVSPQGVGVLQHDTTDFLTAAFATTMGATCSVYYANASGVQQSHGVNVGTSYALPGKPGAGTADIYGWIITPTRPDSATEDKIVRYLSKKAGL